MEATIRQMGVDVALLPAEALEILTGRKAKYYWLDKGEKSVGVDGSLDKNEAWDHIIAHARLSPFILQSRAKTSVMAERHAWWVMEGYVGEGGIRR